MTEKDYPQCDKPVTDVVNIGDVTIYYHEVERSGNVQHQRKCEVW